MADAALKFEALALAVKAEQYAAFLKREGDSHLFPDPDDYIELASMLRKLVAD